MVTENDIVEGLREIYDPELHYNIYDLGLVYDIRIDEDRSVKIVIIGPIGHIGVVSVITILTDRSSSMRMS